MLEDRENRYLKLYKPEIKLYTQSREVDQGRGERGSVVTAVLTVRSDKGGSCGEVNMLITYLVIIT